MLYVAAQKIIYIGKAEGRAEVQAEPEENTGAEIPF
jgi:hypothetical protein